MTFDWIRWCKKHKLDITSIEQMPEEVIAYVSSIEFMLKRQNRLIAQQSHEKSIMNELNNKLREKCHERTTS